MKASEIIDRYSAVPSERGENKFDAYCPSHKGGNEETPSLTLTFEGDKVLIGCWVCGGVNDEPALLTKVGLSKRDLFDVSYVGQTLGQVVRDRKPVRIVGAEVKRSASAKAYAEAVALSAELTEHPGSDLARLLDRRFGITAAATVDELDTFGIGKADDGRLALVARDSDGMVTWRQRRAVDPFTPRHLRWLSDENVDGQRWGRVGFIGNVTGERDVILTEGPSDGLTAALLDDYDVICGRGAGALAHIGELADVLTGRRIIMFPDADDAGRRSVEKVRDALATITSDFYVVETLPEGTDVNDLLTDAPERFPERFTALVDGAVRHEPPMLTGDFNPMDYADNSDLTRARALAAFATGTGHPVAFTPAFGWLVYTGHQGWVRDAESRVRQLAHTLSDVLEARLEGMQDDDEGYAALRRMMGRLRSAASIDNLLKELRAMRGVRQEPDVWDADPDVLGVANGVVDLRTGELRAMLPEDYITRVLTVDYNPEATAPRWEQFMAEVMIGNDRETDPEMVGFMQRLTGYSITGRTDEQMFVMHLGGGGNGKGIYMNTLTDVFHAITTTTPFSTFTASNHAGIRNDLAALAGARIVFSQEAEVGERFAEALIKSVTGQDVISARFLNKEFFEFRPAFLLGLATNTKPKVRGQDVGFWRRVRLIRWRRDYEGRDRALKDTRLKEALLAEAEGILTWAVQGAMAWYANDRRLPEVKSIMDETASYRASEDVLGPFLYLHIEETGDPLDRLFVDDLRRRWAVYAKAEGAGQYSTQRLGDMLDDRLNYEHPTKANIPRHMKGYRIRFMHEVAAIHVAGRLGIEASEVSDTDIAKALDQEFVGYPEFPAYATSGDRAKVSRRMQERNVDAEARMQAIARHRLRLTG